MLHRFARFLVGCTVLLILAGSLVTSNGAGLSVPDWPTSYGWNMFTFPPSMWVANILYEHGHRLIASAVGMLTIVLVVWLWLADTPRWLRWFGFAALSAIVAQGLLGGITVLFFLPPAVSTGHAMLAEIFLCMTVAIALFTSPGWNTVQPIVDDARLRTVASTSTAIVFCQIIIGATMRHTGAGLAIPDFPLMFGHIVPDHWSPAIAIHFAHRAGALVVAAGVASTAIWIWLRHPDQVQLAQPALLCMILLVFQTTLGALTVLTRKQVWISSLHVVGGALLLITSLVITLRAWRGYFPSAAPTPAGTATGRAVSAQPRRAVADTGATA